MTDELTENEQFVHEHLDACQNVARRAALAGASSGYILIERREEDYTVRYMPAESIEHIKEPSLREVAAEMVEEVEIGFPELGIMVMITSKDGLGVYHMMPKAQQTRTRYIQ